MESALVYFALGFGALASIVALVIFMSRARLQENLAALQNKLTLEQSRIVALQERSTQQKPKQESKPERENNKHSAELLELRKSNAHLKNEVKQLKQQLRDTEMQIRDFDNLSEGQLYKLRLENAALVERIKDVEQNSPEKKRAASFELEVNNLRTQLKDIQQELNGANSKLKSERTSAEKQRNELQNLQTELRQLKSRLPDAENSPAKNTTPTIDPKQLAIWKERALTARHMYKMMRQMRELSDLKLSTYQEAVIEVSSKLLDLKGVTVPDLSPQENKADRLLAEAWALIHPDTSPTA